MEPLIEVHKGTSRIVLTSRLFPNIAVKVARVRAITALETFLYFAESSIEHKTKMPWGDVFDPQCDLLPAGLIFYGITENWREYCFFRKTKNEMAVSSYFSLLGVVNLQKREPGLKLTAEQSDRFWNRMMDVAGMELVYDNHHFENPANFSAQNGLQAFDYASPATQKILTKHGVKMRETFAKEFPGLCR